MKTALVDQMALKPAEVKQVISEMLVIQDRRAQALEALVIWVGHMENPEIRQVLIAEMRTLEPMPGEPPSELYQSARAALGE
jgi:outer membrane protein TolC